MQWHEEEAGKRGTGFSLLRVAEQTGGEVRRSDVMQNRRHRLEWGR